MLGVVTLVTRISTCNDTGRIHHSFFQRPIFQTRFNKQCFISKFMYVGIRVTSVTTRSTEALEGQSHTEPYRHGVHRSPAASGAHAGLSCPSFYVYRFLSPTRCMRSSQLQMLPYPQVERWSQDFVPVVKMDRLMRKTIQRIG